MINYGSIWQTHCKELSGICTSKLRWPSMWGHRRFWRRPETISVSKKITIQILWTRRNPWKTHVKSYHLSSQCIWIWTLHEDVRIQNQRPNLLVVNQNNVIIPRICLRWMETWGRCWPYTCTKTKRPIT